MPFRLSRSFVLGAAVAVWFGAASVAPVSAQRKPAKAPAASASAPALVWPLPPEQPRIKFVRSYQGVDDFKTKKKSRFTSLMLGPQDADGQSSDHLVKPYGVATTSTGKLWVTDTASRRLFAFDPTAQAVTFFEGDGAGRLVKPIGVAVDEQDNLFVADGTLKRVFGYTPQGRMFLAIGKDGEFQTPSGLAIDRARHVLYVTDSSLHVVKCYSDVDGHEVRTIGSRGDGPGQFNFPTNVALDRQGRIYVADTFNFRVQIFEADGTFVKAFGTPGDSPGTFNRAKGIGVDSEGHIYVLDAGFNNFQIFDDTGQLLLFVGAPGRRPGEFFLPAGLYVDGEDRIYVADQANARIQVFQYLKAATK